MTIRTANSINKNTTIILLCQNKLIEYPNYLTHHLQELLLCGEVDFMNEIPIKVRLL